MLTFHHLNPSQNNVLNAKMSTFVAKFPSHQHARTTSGIFLPPFFIFLLLLLLLLATVDMKMGRQENSHFSQPAICVQLPVHIFGKKKKTNTEDSITSGAHITCKNLYLLSVIYKLYVPCRL